jgi:competence protein ComEC
MGDAAVVVMALMAGAGAWMGSVGEVAPSAGVASPPVRLAGAVLGSTPAVLAAGALVGLTLLRRRPLLLVASVALAAAALGVRAERGLRPPLVGPFSGVVTLISDPVEVAGAVRAEVRIGGKRAEAWARGRSGARLARRLAGERLAVAGDVGPVPEAARARLRPRHVAARVSVAEVGAWGWGHPASRLANQLRRSLVGGAASLPPDRRALLSGFVLGDDRWQPPEVVDDFRASGFSHLLAVSGQNVAFVLTLAGPLLVRCRLGWRLVLGLTLLALFGVVTRWEPSVIRAVAMASLSLVAFTLGRPVSSLRLLALAVAGLVLVDPLLVHSVGFVLSVGACAGIALLAVPIAARLPLATCRGESFG